ncbi:hypothetical protein SO802_003759 [Lithocarpus litseifolius]|uniref:Uncharacterized protein n=1 Tax=Lithocarpus litseifolius TaxID=425828 RepID=A0AAW2E504_9ROSI
MEEVENKPVILKGYVDILPNESDMEIKVSEIKLKAPKGSGAFLVKNLYLSCDPYMRGCMRKIQAANYLFPPFVPGQALEGFGVSKVIDSDDPDFKPGDVVSGFTGWEEYNLIHKTEYIVSSKGFLLLLLLLFNTGMPGFTAYAGFFEICSPKKGEYVLVSAASGAVGQLVGQLAKLHGCSVVGSAGTSQKVDHLKNKLGFDEAFNYKEEPNLDAALKRFMISF